MDKRRLRPSVTIGRRNPNTDGADPLALSLSAGDVVAAAHWANARSPDPPKPGRLRHLDALALRGLLIEGTNDQGKLGSAIRESRLGVSVMRRSILACAFGGSVFAASLGMSCGDSGAGGEGGDEGNPAYEDVVFEGGATDEALDALVMASLVDDPSSAANFTAPTDGVVVPATSAPTFTWKLGPVASATPALSGSRYARDHSAPFDANGASPFEHSRGAPLWLEHVASRGIGMLLAGVPPAYAHGTPTSGPAYFLLFTTSTNDKLLRVFTSSTSYTPDDSAFGKLKGAGGTITAVITNAQFDQNRIAQDGGPWKGTAITFTVM
jgi:hypothetical protein